MNKFEFPTKKFIAVSVIATICALAIVQGLTEKTIPTEFLTLGGTIIGYYFGFSRGEAVEKKEGAN